MYSLLTKNGQDAYLGSLISHTPIKQRRPRIEVEYIAISDTDDNIRVNENITIEVRTQPHSVSFSYKVRYLAIANQICAIAFQSLYGITRARVRRIHQALIQNGSPPEDKRGRCGIHYRQTPKPLITLIKALIKTLKVRQSHYTLRHNSNKYYVHKDKHSVVQIHKDFIENYQVNMSYKVFLKVFNNLF